MQVRAATPLSGRPRHGSMPLDPLPAALGLWHPKDPPPLPLVTIYPLQFHPRLPALPPRRCPAQTAPPARDGRCLQSVPAVAVGSRPRAPVRDPEPTPPPSRLWGTLAAAGGVGGATARRRGVRAAATRARTGGGLCGTPRAATVSARGTAPAGRGWRTQTGREGGGGRHRTRHRGRQQRTRWPLGTAARQRRRPAVASPATPGDGGGGRVGREGAAGAAAGLRAAASSSPMSLALPVR